MRFGYWLPVFGGWLRNVPDEGMEASWEYISKLARRSEEIGFDLTLIAELFLNDIKGADAPVMDAWSTAAALAAITTRLELMVAVRPTFHQPAILAKQAANIDRISNGRLSLNVVSSWWKGEATRFGIPFDDHDDRYARTADWLKVIDGCWNESRFTHSGPYYNVAETIVEPKPARNPRPVIYAGGESEAARTLISTQCDAYVMHGDPLERIAGRIADMRNRRDALNEARHKRGERELPAMQFGMAGYTIVRDTEKEARAELARITNVAEGSPQYHSYQDWVKHTQLETTLALEEYAVSNRGLRPGFVGTPEQVAERVDAYARVGVDLLLLQCSPQLEEMERFGDTVIPLVRGSVAVAA
jgi:FMNH2-dependent dimethyl sulfone monooxygenase